jgi:ABC-2 type transport system ATP-binding protein
LQLDALLPTVREVLGERGLAVVTVHQLSVAEHLADRIVILDRGRVLAEGPLDELRAKAGVQEGSLETVFRALLEEETRRVAT